MRELLLLDTSVLIPLRDGDQHVAHWLRSLRGQVYVSMISVVELERGVEREPQQAAVRRATLETLLSGVTLLDFGICEARCYGQIVAHAGNSRRKLIDRMIAAQALVADATLVTMNPDDFADVPALKVRACSQTG